MNNIKCFYYCLIIIIFLRTMTYGFLKVNSEDCIEYSGIKGYPAKINFIGFVVLNKEHICNTMLITVDLGISAASCFISGTEAFQNYFLILNYNQRYITTALEHLYIYPEYSFGDPSNDIALLKIAGSLDFNYNRHFLTRELYNENHNYGCRTFGFCITSECFKNNITSITYTSNIVKSYANCINSSESSSEKLNSQDFKATYYNLFPISDLDLDYDIIYYVHDALEVYHNNSDCSCHTQDTNCTIMGIDCETKCDNDIEYIDLNKSAGQNPFIEKYASSFCMFIKKIAKKYVYLGGPVFCKPHGGVVQGIIVPTPESLDINALLVLDIGRADIMSWMQKKITDLQRYHSVIKNKHPTLISLTSTKILILITLVFIII